MRTHLLRILFWLKGLECNFGAGGQSETPVGAHDNSRCVTIHS